MGMARLPRQGLTARPGTMCGVGSPAAPGMRSRWHVELSCGHHRTFFTEQGRELSRSTIDGRFPVSASSEPSGRAAGLDRLAVRARWQALSDSPLLLGTGSVAQRSSACHDPTMVEGMSIELKFFFYLAAVVCFVVAAAGTRVRAQVGFLPLGLALFVFPTLWDTGVLAF